MKTLLIFYFAFDLFVLPSTGLCQYVSKKKSDRYEKFYDLMTLLVKNDDNDGIDLLIDYAAGYGHDGELDLVSYATSGFKLRSDHIRKILKIVVGSNHDDIVYYGLEVLGDNYASICTLEEVKMIKPLARSKNRRIARAAVDALSEIEKEGKRKE